MEVGVLLDEILHIYLRFGPTFSILLLFWLILIISNVFAIIGRGQSSLFTLKTKMQPDFCKKNKKIGRPKTTDACSYKQLKNHVAAG